MVNVRVFNPRSLLALCAALLPCASSHALSLLDDRVEVHGFLSQAAFYTSGNNLHGNSEDNISTDMNEAGINTAIKPWENWRVAGQVTARNDGKSDNGALRTDYFNVDWQFLAQQSWRMGARVGRVRNIYGLYNDTRDVAHTRPGIAMPTVAYLDQVRDVFVARDGYALYGDHYSDSGALSVDIGQGEIPVNSNTVSEAVLLKVDAQAVNPRTDQIHIRWDDPSNAWRVAWSFLRFTSDIDRDGYDFVLTMRNLSVQYTAERWQLTSEFVAFDYDLHYFIDAYYPGAIAYAQFTYFLSPEWQVYTRYEHNIFDRHHPNGSSMEPFFPRHVGYRRDAGVGVRWDIDAHWMAAFEAHYVEGVLGISTNDNVLAETTPYWRIVAAEIAFRF